MSEIIIICLHTGIWFQEFLFNINNFQSDLFDYRWFWFGLVYLFNYILTPYCLFNAEIWFICKFVKHSFLTQFIHNYML